MNYAFKIMAVVLALGVLTKVDFAIANNEKQIVKSNLPSCPKSPPFINCYGFYKWSSGDEYVGEWKNAKRHGHGTYIWANGNKYVGEWQNGKTNGQGTKTWKKYGGKYVGEMKDDLEHGYGIMKWRNGDKYEGQWKKGIANGEGIIIYGPNSKIPGARYKGQIKDGKMHGEGKYVFANGEILEGIFKNDVFMNVQNIKKENKKYSKTFNLKSKISAAELDAERKKRIELERKLAALKSKQKQEQQRIASDNQQPIINAFSKQDGSNAIISGRVTDNTQVAEVLIDGEQLSLNNNGTFKTELYIPRNGLNIKIVAYDKKGNKASKLMKIKRGNIQQVNVQKFKSLNPSTKKVRNNPNALALIIGISDYENTKASALYADSDAKTFYDYANLKLGVSSSNIKELIGNNAERLDIVKSVRNFLLKRTITNKTDIYVFFAGHGLATDDGKGMYLLPYDGVPDLLEDSAIRRKELFADIQATKPRSVTVFLDTCYSGGTRNEEETLVASLRPIIITAKQQSIPDNFTVLSAAKGNQTSQSLDEVKHGLFSYYMMLGMESGADLNADKKITARELHEYVVDKVERQSQFRQTPELQGDKDRVLVQFN